MEFKIFTQPFLKKHFFNITCIIIILIFSSFSAGLSFKLGAWLDDAISGHKVVFRYRTFEDKKPDWVSSISKSGKIDHSEGSSDIYSLDRGKGFSRFISTNFNGTSEYIKGTKSISTRDNKFNDSFTLQAWFCPDDVSGYHCLISNMADGKGFSLKIKDGKLRALVRFKKSKKYVNKELSGGLVESNKWYHAALRVKKCKDKYILRLFLNGSQVAYLESNVYNGIRQSKEKPMIGAEPENGVGKNNFFKGLIYAVSVNNYAIDINNYLKIEPIRDGSRYLGAVSCHDYLSRKKGVDLRVLNTVSKYKDLEKYLVKRWYCPFLNDNYVPQGISTNGTNRVYITMYWKDKLGNSQKYPSLLVEMNTSGKLLRTMPLLKSNGQAFTGHVGGCAWWNDYVYIPDGSHILRFNLKQAKKNLFDFDTLETPPHDENVLTADAVYKCNLDDNKYISFLSTSIDGNSTPILWTGAFSEKEKKRIIGFEISQMGDVKLKAQYNFLLPVTKVQGIYCYNTSGVDFDFYITTSYGDKTSKIYQASYVNNNEIANDYEVKMTGPAGFEDLGMIDNQLWCVSESGSSYYQKRNFKSDVPTSWKQFFPYVFYLNFD